MNAETIMHFKRKVFNKDTVRTALVVGFFLLPFFFIRANKLDVHLFVEIMFATIGSFLLGIIMVLVYDMIFLTDMDKEEKREVEERMESEKNRGNPEYIKDLENKILSHGIYYKIENSNQDNNQNNNQGDKA